MHIPVMLREVLTALDVKAGGTYIDATFGGGGYSRAMLEMGANVIAFDRDASVIPTALAFEKEFLGRFSFYNLRFSEILSVLPFEADGLVADIGVSSMQIDEAERGFSYMRDGALAMQMGLGELSADDVVNGYKEADLANVLYKYGELRNSRTLAKKIVAARPVKTTSELAKIIGIEFASRAFQAVRIEVNGELDELAALLDNAHSIVKPGGRLVIVDFHSLEDRIVKKFFQAASGSRYSLAEEEKKYFIPTPKNAILPSDEEIAANPRAGSAKLRAGVRID